MLRRVTYDSSLDLACTFEHGHLTFWRRWENAYLPLDSPIFRLALGLSACVRPEPRDPVPTSAPARPQ